MEKVQESEKCKIHPKGRRIIKELGYRFEKLEYEANSLANYTLDLEWFSFSNFKETGQNLRGR